MKTTEQKLEFLNSLGLDIDFSQVDLEQTEDFDSLYSLLEDASLLDVEIIYYSRAIEFLKENDPSLNDSLAIADEYGFQVKDLNSEKLASLLASQILRDEFSEKRDEIDEFLQSEDEEETED